MSKIFIALFFFITSNAMALSPEERLENPADEKRANELFLEVRCIVCNGQVIENSDSQFSYDMRQFIRGKIKAGKSNEEIKEELIKEFGSDILTSTDQKWVIIFVFLIITFFIFFLYQLLHKGSKNKA